MRIPIAEVLRAWDGWMWTCLLCRWAGHAPTRDGAEHAARSHYTITHGPDAPGGED